jgi:hypothetical protein
MCGGLLTPSTEEAAAEVLTFSRGSRYAVEAESMGFTASLVCRPNQARRMLLAHNC